MKGLKMLHNKNSHEELIKKLKDEKQADAYFYDVIAECKTVEKKQAKLLLTTALKNITQARGGFGSYLTNSGAESFYNMIASVMLPFVL
jgi:hypothetical protein